MISLSIKPWVPLYVISTTIHTSHGTTRELYRPPSPSPPSITRDVYTIPPPPAVSLSRHLSSHHSSLFLISLYSPNLPKMKLNESGFRPPLCTYRLNWVRRTSWGWWDDWDDTVLQTQDSKFEPWRSETEHATSRSRRLPTILTFTRGWGRNIFCFFQTAESGNRAPNSSVKGSSANHYPRAPAPNLPASTIRWANVGTMLNHWLWRWPSIISTHQA